MNHWLMIHTAEPLTERLGYALVTMVIPLPNNTMITKFGRNACTKLHYLQIKLCFSLHCRYVNPLSRRRPYHLEFYDKRACEREHNGFPFMTKLASFGTMGTFL